LKAVVLALVLLVPANVAARSKRVRTAARGRAVAAAAPASDARATAWDRSVAAEQAGDLRRAEAIMTEAWGSRPDNYWARLRLAYLALLQGRSGEACERYRELRDWPEAQSDADVHRGYASALAASGSFRLAHGDTAQARVAFAEALKVDPDNAAARWGLAQVPVESRVEPELWMGVSGQELGRTRYLGWVAYGNLPVHLTEHFTVRASGRHMSMFDRSVASSWSLGDSKVPGWNLNEGFLGVNYESRALAGELVGALSSASGTAMIRGGGGSLRVGRSAGLLAEGAFLSDGRLTNAQLRPLAFVWLGAHVGLQAGARLTLDDRGNAVSANAGASLVFESVELFLKGHWGDERWGFDSSGPSLMSFEAAPSWGGSATVLWQVSRHVRLAVQGEGERLHQEGAFGSFWSVSGGIQVGLGDR
jgi:Tfp pilus assembly protein PilF